MKNTRVSFCYHSMCLSLCMQKSSSTAYLFTVSVSASARVRSPNRNNIVDRSPASFCHQILSLCACVRVCLCLSGSPLCVWGKGADTPEGTRRTVNQSSGSEDLISWPAIRRFEQRTGKRFTVVQRQKRKRRKICQADLDGLFQ